MYGKYRVYSTRVQDNLTEDTTMDIKAALTALDQPKKVPASLSTALTMAVRLTEPALSTHKAIWTKPGKAMDSVQPLAVFPGKLGYLSTIFPDTLVVGVPTRVRQAGTEEKPLYAPVDAKLMSRVIQGLTGEVGTVSSLRPIEGSSKFLQEYYISTCNIPFDVLYPILERLVNGEVRYEGEAVQLIRFDLTSNWATGTVPSDTGCPELLAMGWEYFDNSSYVGETCHTYRTTEGFRVKDYCKFRYMLENGTVREKLGDNLKNLLVSPQKNINLMFRSPVFQENGCSRIETSFDNFSDGLKPLWYYLELHAQYEEYLIPAHNYQPTSLQDSWETFLQPNHSQKLVIVDNQVTSKLYWTLTRYTNKLTEKTSGMQGSNLESALHALKYRTMGQYNVDIYWVEVSEVEGKVQQFITHAGTLLPDVTHNGSLVHISEGHKTQAEVTKHSWLEAGLELPWRLAATNDKPRNLSNFRGMPFIPTNFASIKTEARLATKAVEKEAKAVAKANEKAAKQRQKRLEAAKVKVLAQVAKDKFSKAPSDYKKHGKMEHLSKVAKPICTRYYLQTASESRYPSWMVKVGSGWYKANYELGKKLEQTPSLPFLIKAWDSGEKTSQGYKKFNVELKELDYSQD